MTRLLPVALLAIASACVIATPRPPAPPSTYRLQVYAKADNAALLTARMYRDNAKDDDAIVGPDGGRAWELAPSDFNVCAHADGYIEHCAPVPLHADLTLTIALEKAAAPIEPPTPIDPPAPSTPTWTRAQLTDMQGDLMIWAPEIGCAPEANIRCDAKGLQAGWIWTLTVWRYSAEHRAALYAKAKALGWTHWALHVAACEPGDGYHHLYPTDCVGYDAALNTVLHELRDHHLIAICAGAAPGVAIANIDRALCPIAMDDWDNSCQLWGRLEATAAAFPQALLYMEVPTGCRFAEPSGGTEPIAPTSTNGGAWIREAQRRYPNLLGVLHETDDPAKGVDANAQLLADANPFFRDLQQVLFETDTYWKFWDALSFSVMVAYNDALRHAVPWTQGFLSGGTTHPAPVEHASAGGFVGELDASAVSVVNAPDFRAWPQTTTLSRVAIDLDNVRVTFDKQDGAGRWPDVTPPGWSGALQYSLGLCLKPAATWYCNAPIELWHGKDGAGGPIQQPGQIPSNWFYDARWGALRGYQPRPGEQIGVFVVAGDARNAFTPTAERSNIVLVTLPAPGEARTFAQ